MKNPLIIAAALAALSACAHQPSQVSPTEDLNLQVAAALKPLPFMCMSRAMHSTLLLADDAPASVKKEQAFKNYYEAFLDAKEQGKYVDCLRKQWSVPWLHAEYRRGRRWLKVSQKEVADNAPVAGADLRISDVAETFIPQGGDQTLRRVVITLASGGRKTVEETFSTKAGGS